MRLFIWWLFFHALIWFQVETESANHHWDWLLVVLPFISLFSCIASGGFSSLLNRCLHKAGGPMATIAEECVWLTYPKIGLSSEYNPIIAYNMLKMKQMVIWVYYKIP